MFKFFGIGNSKENKKSELKEEDKNVENEVAFEKKNYDKDLKILPHEEKNIWTNVETKNDDDSSPEQFINCEISKLNIQDNFFSFSDDRKVVQENISFVERLKTACDKLSDMDIKVSLGDILNQYLGKDYSKEYAFDWDDNVTDNSRSMLKRDDLVKYVEWLENCVECLYPFFEGFYQALHDGTGKEKESRIIALDFFRYAVGDDFYNTFQDNKIPEIGKEKLVKGMEILLIVDSFVMAFFKTTVDPLKEVLGKLDFSCTHTEGILYVNQKVFKRLALLKKELNFAWDENAFFENKTGEDLANAYPQPDTVLDLFSNLVSSQYKMKNIINGDLQFHKYCVVSPSELKIFDFNCEMFLYFHKALNQILKTNALFDKYFDSKTFVLNALTGILGADWLSSHTFYKPKKVSEKQLSQLANVLFNMLTLECLLNKPEGKELQLLSEKLNIDNNDVEIVFKKLIPNKQEETFLINANKMNTFSEIVIFFDFLKKTVTEIRSMISSLAKISSKSEKDKVTYKLPEFSKEQMETYFIKGTERIFIEDKNIMTFV